MNRFSQRSSPYDDERTGDLLHTLLQAPVPAERDPLRPVALRSTSQQRRYALRSFLVRTWLDRLLYRAEQLLMLAVIIFFLYWLLDGYGRDWLHQQQQPASPPPAGMTVPGMSSQVIAVAVVTRTGELTDTRHRYTPTLPFTPAELEQETAAHPPRAPDYIAPRAAAVPAVSLVPGDPRPQRLTIPAIDVNTPVDEVFIEDGIWQVAEYAAGYHHGSALPGEDGNTVMAGHAGLRGAVFRHLGRLQVSDEIFVDAGGWRFRYQVRQHMNVWPTQVEVMAATPTPVLTLITCTAWDTQRLVVIADLIDSSPL